MDNEQAGFYTLDEALESLRFGKFQAFVLAYAGMGWFAEAMEVMILSFIGQAVKSEWDLSSSQESLLSTIVFAGMVIGAYGWGTISDTYGRRCVLSFYLNHKSLIMPIDTDLWRIILQKASY